jgi:hypothetical protein
MKCHTCKTQHPLMIKIFQWDSGTHVWNNKTMCFKCAYEKGKYDSLRPDDNVWTDMDNEKE